MQLPDSKPHSSGKILDHDAGLGEASEEMVEVRARELAEIAGLDPKESAQDFLREARAELRGSADTDSPADDEADVANLTSWDDIPGESGGAVSPQTSGSANEDEETIGQSLYAEGVSEADHDRMVESRAEELRNARDEEK